MLDTKARLKELMGEADFRPKSNLETPEDFRRFAERTARGLDLIDSLGEDREERIQNLLGLLLAGTFQPIAQEKYGDAGDESVRKVVREKMGTFEGWEKKKTHPQRSPRNAGLYPGRA
jgi:hypothetical protein